MSRRKIMIKTFDSVNWENGKKAYWGSFQVSEKQMFKIGEQISYADLLHCKRSSCLVIM